MNYGSNYPSSSGPPPPPGGGYGYGAPQYGQYPQQPQYGAPPGGYNPYSSYSPYAAAASQPMPPQPYGGYGQQQPYPYQQQPPQPYGGAPGYGAPPPHGGPPPGAAVPGFTVPAAPQGYGGAPPMAPPPSMNYNMAGQHMQNQLNLDMQMRYMQGMGIVSADDSAGRRRMKAAALSEEDDEDHEEEKRKYEERIRKAEERAKELQEKLEGDTELQDKLKETFITELMRRQAVSGTFEMTEGTITPFDAYDEEDCVAQWFLAEKEQDISGEKWDALYDAEFIRKAIRGWGTDEDAIIELITSRCNAQRNQIMKDYKTSYGRDLVKDLSDDTSGDFRQAILGLFETPARYDAWCVKKAIYGLGTDERTLIEILLTRTNEQIKEMVEQYNQITYEKQSNPESAVEQDIEDDCSANFKRLLISACTGGRRMKCREELEEAVEPQMVGGKFTGLFQVNYAKLCNADKCRRMAEELFKAGEDRWGTDEETFNRIFSTQDMYTLHQVYEEYVKITQRDILNTVERETSGDYRKGLEAIVQCVKCRPLFFAERLHKAMKGLGTDDKGLIRLVVTRSELDMVQIKQCFRNSYQKTLWKYIKHDTSGDYRKLLLAIVGKN